MWLFYMDDEGNYMVLLRVAVVQNIVDRFGLEIKELTIKWDVN